MSSSHVVACPKCKKRLKVSEEMAGKKVRCRNCEAVFPVKIPSGVGAGEQKPAKPKAEKAPKQEKPKKSMSEMLDDFDEEETGDKAYLTGHMDLSPRCPTCAAELESEEQVICLNCGYNLRKRMASDHKVVYENTGGDQFNWLLPGIGCAIGVVLLITIDVLCILKMKSWIDGGFLSFMDFLKKDDGGWYLKPGAFSFYITLGSALFIIPMTKFAIKRLVYDNKPPEVEKR